MPIELIIRKMGSSEEGKPHSIKETGEGNPDVANKVLDTDEEFARVLAFFPKGQESQYEAVVGSEPWSYERLVKARDAIVNIHLPMPKIGPIEISLPDNPLAQAKAPMKGPLEGTVSLDNPNHLDVTVDRKGLQFHFSNQPVLLKVAAKVGEALDVNLRLEAQAGDLSGNLSFDGKTEVRIKDLLAGLNLDGFVMLSDSKVGLDGIVVRNVLKEASLRFDPATRTISLTVGNQFSPPKTQPPAALPDWLNWPCAEWAAYRAELNDPARQFLAVIEEPLSNLPDVTVPPGKGRIYVNLDKSEFSVGLKGHASAQAAVMALFDQVAASVKRGMIREYPVPSDEMLKGYNGPEIVYNDQQRAEGTFFLLGENDTTQLIVNSLGLSSSIVRNHRIDMGDFSQSKILGRYFKDSLPRLVATLKNDASDPDFPNWPLRALAILGHLNTDFESMVSKKRIYRNEYTRQNFFINFDYDPTRPRAYQDEKHVNATSLTYLPYDPKAVEGTIAEKDKLAEALTWLPDKSALSFRYAPSQTISSCPSGDSSASLSTAHYEYKPDAGDQYLKRAAGRLTVLPLTDDQGRTRSVLIADHMVGITGDLAFLKGRDRDYGENADPLGLPLTTLLKEEPPKKDPWPPPEESQKQPEAPKEEKPPFLNTDRVGSMVARAQGIPITAALPVLANGPMTQLTNALIHRLKTGDWVSSPPIYQVPSTPEGVKIPPEFLSVDLKKEVFLVTVTKETNVEFVKKMLTNGFGISPSQAAQMIPTQENEQGKKVKEIPVKEIYEKSPLKTLFDEKQFLRWMRTRLDMPEMFRKRFRSQGTIAMVMAKDLREKVAKMKPGEFLFRDFNHPMFRGEIGPTKEQSYDVAVNGMYFLTPAGGNFTVENLANTFGKPENFTQSDSYPSVKRVDPSQDSLAGVSAELKPYYDCAAQEKIGNYCIEAKLNVNRILHHRLRVTEKPVDGYMAPWDIMLVPGLSVIANGMYSNSGAWSFYEVTLDGSKYILGENLRILNTKIDKEETVQGFAFTRMGPFLSSMVKVATGQDMGFSMKTPLRYKE